MGFFSYNTSDTNESIPSCYSDRETFAVKLLDGKGGEWIEHNYEGYGVFGGKDIHALIDEINGGDGDRDNGIKLAFSKDTPAPLLPKLVRLECATPFEELAPLSDCPNQGFFY